MHEIIKNSHILRYNSKILVFFSLLANSENSYAANEQLVPISYPKLLWIPAEKLDVDSGPQDSRAFEFNKEAWVIFNMLRTVRTQQVRQMHIYNVSRGGKAIPLTIEGSIPRTVEKNWTPFVHASRIHFIYSFVPLVVRKVF